TPLARRLRVSARRPAREHRAATPSPCHGRMLALESARVQHARFRIDSWERDMGLLDQILGGLTGGGMQGQGQAPMGQGLGSGAGGAVMALLPIVLGMLSNRGGGMGSAAAPGVGGGAGMGGLGGLGG